MGLVVFPSYVPPFDSFPLNPTGERRSSSSIQAQAGGRCSCSGGTITIKHATIQRLNKLKKQSNAVSVKMEVRAMVFRMPCGNTLTVAFPLVCYAFHRSKADSALLRCIHHRGNHRHPKLLTRLLLLGLVGGAKSQAVPKQGLNHHRTEVQATDLLQDGECFGGEISVLDFLDVALSADDDLDAELTELYVEVETPALVANITAFMGPAKLQSFYDIIGFATTEFSCPSEDEGAGEAEEAEDFLLATSRSLRGAFLEENYLEDTTNTDNITSCYNATGTIIDLFQIYLNRESEVVNVTSNDTIELHYEIETTYLHVEGTVLIDLEGDEEIESMLAGVEDIECPMGEGGVELSETRGGRRWWRRRMRIQRRRMRLEERRRRWLARRLGLLTPTDSGFGARMRRRLP